MRQILLFITCLLSNNLFAQELTIESMTALPMDLSASQFERKDLNGKACALVKVQLTTMGAQFEGNVVGTTDYKTNEYWVYMTEGSYMLNIKHPNFVTLSVNFRDYDINGVQGKATYRLTLLMPQTGELVQNQKLTINYTPANAIVLVDSKTYTGNGRVELTLPVGSHDYQIVAAGYNPAEGSVKLNANSPRTITENLTASAPAQGQQQASSQQPTPVISANTSSSNVIETFTVKGVSFNMVRVDGGELMIGNTKEQDSVSESGTHSQAKKSQKAKILSFMIGETEVTQALWKAIMGDKNPITDNDYSIPVDSVTWNDCQLFISKLNKLTGKNFRLPTEDEWEYAARGGNKSKHFKYSGSNVLNDVAWNEHNSGKTIHPIKTRKPNELNIYDMSGNVWEWCADILDWSHNQTQPPGNLRAYRGGSCTPYSSGCQVSSRVFAYPKDTYRHIGFRLAL